MSRVRKPAAAGPKPSGGADFLRTQPLAMHYLPERAVNLAEMPATPSGKKQKFKLREPFSNVVANR
jgi:cyclohexanecarboxylate-CoA ligase